MIKVSEFKSCINEPPAVDGDYLVARIDYTRKEVYSGIMVHYTVAHGWNTYPDHWNNAVDYEGNAFWATLSYEEEPVRFW